MNSREDDSYRRTQHDGTANDLNYSVSQMKSTKFYDKSLIQTKKDSQFDRDSDRNEFEYGKSLAKTANSKKHVSFKNNTSDLTHEVPSRDGVLRKKDVNSVADQIANDKIKQLH